MTKPPFDTFQKEATLEKSAYFCLANEPLPSLQEQLLLFIQSNESNCSLFWTCIKTWASIWELSHAKECKKIQQKKFSSRGMKKNSITRSNCLQNHYQKTKTYLKRSLRKLLQFTMNLCRTCIFLSSKKLKRKQVMKLTNYLKNIQFRWFQF